MQRRLIGKMRKYGTLAANFNMDVYPMGFETQGTWGSCTHMVFDAILKRIQNNNNMDRVSHETKSHYWKQQISFILQIYCTKKFA